MCWIYSNIFILIVRRITVMGSTSRYFAEWMHIILLGIVLLLIFNCSSNISNIRNAVIFQGYRIKSNIFLTLVCLGWVRRLGILVDSVCRVRGKTLEVACASHYDVMKGNSQLHLDSRTDKVQQNDIKYTVIPSQSNYNIYIYKIPRKLLS